MPSTSKSAVANKATRQCWDCLKRRLVCDFTLPQCKKCLKNGRQCSGYDEKKPLQWVEPGSVLSRKRRKGPRTQVLSAEAPRPSLSKDARVVELGEGVERSDDGNANDTTLTRLAYGTVKQDTIDPITLGSVLELADRFTIKLIIAEKRKDDAHKILSKASSPERALKALEHLISVLERENIPAYNLRTDASDAVQAVQYRAKPP